MEFTHGFTTARFLVTLIRSCAWSGFNVLVLMGLQHLDHTFAVSETMLSILVIPIGLIEVAVCIYGCYQLRPFYWKTAWIGAVSVANFWFFMLILVSLYSQSGTEL